MRIQLNKEIRDEGYFIDLEVLAVELEIQNYYTDRMGCFRVKYCVIFGQSRPFPLLVYIFY